MKSKNRILIFFVNMGLLGVSLLFVELALQLASVFFVDVDLITRRAGTSVPMLVDDDRLGIRGNPEWWEHDARGFRNPSALSSAIVVALGDSHTYGTSVSSEESWPRIVSTHLGKDVYNMGLEGYGPTQNLENLSIAIELKPKLIIFGLYFGNDFSDDFRFAQKNGLLWKYANQGALVQISELESQKTIEEEIGFLFRSGRTIEGNPANRSPSETSETGNFPWIIRKWLSDHSKLYGPLRTLKNQIVSYSDFNASLARDFHRAKENLSDWQSPYVSVYDGPTWKTIFTSPYRLRTLDDADPRIGAGIEISKRMLEQMRLRVSESGAEYLVLLLPTKEYVFWPRVENPDEHMLLAELVRHENRIHNEIKRFMQDHGIDFIDPVTELRESEGQPYFPDGDGHPNALGQKIIAEKVLKFIKRHQI